MKKLFVVLLSGLAMAAFAADAEKNESNDIHDSERARKKYELLDEVEPKVIYELTQEEVTQLPTKFKSKVDQGGATLALIKRSVRTSGNLSCEESWYWAGFESGFSQSNRTRYGATYRCFGHAE